MGGAELEGAVEAVPRNRHVGLPAAWVLAPSLPASPQSAAPSDRGTTLPAILLLLDRRVTTQRSARGGESSLPNVVARAQGALGEDCVRHCKVCRGATLPQSMELCRGGDA
eukprot:CAMPEP_0181328028 /NCGR_PEP_ID=MMETSP1101-20121128/22459_1 /TAXON_ID=46948 /ORGANISM="Rhodomonas abbreviata, Strain Caron Lab Isolate" /LENGTH=110 /DNA_ID=CAMNT_0023436813 /DNA_START=141 /DNA_END=473 /DNA_ORIENTATION=+